MSVDLSVSSVFYPVLMVITALAGMIAVRFGFQRGRELRPSIRDFYASSRLAAFYHRSRLIPVTMALAAFGIWLVFQQWSALQGNYQQFKPFFLLFGGLFFFQLVLATFSGSFRARSQAETDRADLTRVIVVVPVYNESETSLREGLESFFYQTHLPAEIHIVDDGSRDDYVDLQNWFLSRASAMEIAATWTKQPNAGKRMAQDTAFSKITDATNAIIVTIDSDGVLAPDAIEKGLIPFRDPQVQSVAGIVVAKNAQDNALARFTDLIFVAGQQLIDRAAMSVFGNVLVNSGGLAFYRPEVIADARASGYVSERFFGREIQFSDDSYLTLFALMRGKTVQQTSTFVFADMPVTFSHHIRQQLRWNRGSFIRSWWRLRHLKVWSYGFIRQVLGYVVFFSMMVIILQIFVLEPLVSGSLPPWQFFVIPILLAFVQNTRYFSVRRNDMSLRSQIGTYLLTPVAVLWSLFVLRPLRLWGFATCLKTGWNTRTSVEIERSTDRIASAIKPVVKSPAI